MTLRLYNKNLNVNILFYNLLNLFLYKLEFSIRSLFSWNRGRLLNPLESTYIYSPKQKDLANATKLYFNLWIE